MEDAAAEIGYAAGEIGEGQRRNERRRLNAWTPGQARGDGEGGRMTGVAPGERLGPGRQYAE